VNVRWQDVPDHAAPVFAAEMRRCDSLNLVVEGRLQWRPGAGPGEREYRLIGGSVGWWSPNPETGYPGVPGYLAEFWNAGLLASDNFHHPDDWRGARLTRAGEFLWMTWVRDSHRRRALLNEMTAEASESDGPDEVIQTR
jgi:hypothetical protein